MQLRPQPTARRRFLLALAALGVSPRLQAAVTPPTGWVQPRSAAPAWPLQCADGRTRGLDRCLQGRVTAVQLMFTGCNGSCPVQGALFAEMTSRLPAASFQLLSISIDALGDDTASLRNWQSRFRTASTAAWLAGVPPLKAVDALSAFLRGLPAGAALTHTSQVFVFDREGRLAYRTGDNPEAAWLQALMDHIGRGG